MAGSLLTAGSYVSVAVAFDDHTAALVRCAGELARRLGKKVALIHVSESPIVDEPTRPFAVPSAVWDRLPDYVAKNREAARLRLEELSRAMSPAVDCCLVQVEGQAVDSLCREAAALGSCVLLVGTNASRQGFVLRGFSTAMSLLAAATCPVLVVDGKLPMPDFSKSIRILMADDLSDQAEPAVSVAADLADQLAGSTVQHLHVSAFTPENLKTVLQGAAAFAHVAFDGSEAETISEAVFAERRATLEARFSDYRDYVEAAGSHYDSMVVAGDVQTELGKVVATFQPDLLVFGRHHSWHRKPFFFGRLPFRAMMNFACPVLVVPGTEQA